MKSMVDISHEFLKPVLHKQSICVDATLGQGKDTDFFLSQNVHKVYGFEIQRMASKFKEMFLKVQKNDWMIKKLVSIMLDMNIWKNIFMKKWMRSFLILGIFLKEIMTSQPTLLQV